jgi:TolB-like protein
MIYRFEDCSLDTDRRELRRGDTRVELEPQVFDLLEFLIRTRDRVASRDDVLEAVWKGRIVSESTLSSRINAARTAVGDDGTSQHLIRTLPRKGFRFVGEVQTEQQTSPQAPPPTATEEIRANASLAEGPSIAVLPFTNMSGDAESDYFADGMAEEIITALSRCGGILVIARNSSFIYKGRAIDIRQVGRELGVSFVLEGSVRRHDDRLRITAQLIEATAGTHLWADRYDGSLSDVFELQDRIAANAAAVIEPKLRFTEVERARRLPPQNLDAYDLWLKAVAHASDFTADSLAEAMWCLDRALEIDPTYALAMATAAYYHAHCHFQGWVRKPDDRREVAIRQAQHAVELGKDDPNVLWQAAFAIWSLEQNGAKALELFRRSLEINPNSAMALAMSGWVESANGNPHVGRQQLEKSQRLNPRLPRGWFHATAMAITCVIDENFHEAITWAEKALLQNRRFAIALRVLAVALVNTGQIDRAREVVAEALAIEPDLTVSGLGARLPIGSRSILTTYRAALRQAGLPD